MQMELILLKNVKSLGRLGETVRVAMGYGRHLLREKMALRANAENTTLFQGQKAQWEALNLQHKLDAETLATLLNGKVLILVRQAGEAGHLYGSVSARDVADGLVQQGFVVDRSAVALSQPIKTIGVHPIPLELHADVRTQIHVVVAKSLEEGEIQKKKLALTSVGPAEAGEDSVDPTASV
jgi:large subunit ribosomal protein L9